MKKLVPCEPFSADLVLGPKDICINNPIKVSPKKGPIDLIEENERDRETESESDGYKKRWVFLKSFWVLNTYSPTKCTLVPQNIKPEQNRKRFT